MKPIEKPGGLVGRMRHWVDVYEVTDGAKDDYGARAEVKTKIATVAADVIEGSGGDVMFGQQPEGKGSHQVRIWYFADLNAKRHYFVYDGRRLNIGSITNPDGRRMWHVCRCTEEIKRG